MSDGFWKVPFEWPGERRPEAAADPAGVRWSIAAETDGFIGLAAECLPVSVDAWHRTAVAHMGAERTAEMITMELTGFSHRPEWWQVLHVDEQPAGFVLPAVFDDCQRDGLDEATLLLIGVRPRHRGAGLGRLLLRRATAIVVKHGVWRIYSDTASDNTPMINLFQKEGWRRLPAHRRPTFAPPT